MNGRTVCVMGFDSAAACQYTRVVNLLALFGVLSPKASLLETKLPLNT